MTGSICLNISGISFEIASSLPIDIASDDTIYQPFLTEGKAASFFSSSLNISIDPLPESGALSLIYDNHESWSMATDGIDYFIFLRDRGLENAIITARISRDFKTGTIYCNAALIDSSSGSILNPLRYPLDQILVMHILAKNSGAIVHSTGLVIGNSGYIFPGRAGAGKSTIASLFQARNDVTVLSDDRMIIRQEDSEYRIFGTPWPSDGRMAINRGASLKCIIFLAHADINRIERLSSVQAAEMLITVVSIPWYDREAAGQLIVFCDRLVTEIPVYMLYFKPDKEAADFITRFAGTAAED
jgi:hypothetical protein